MIKESKLLRLFLFFFSSILIAQELPPYNWSEVLNIPPLSISEGHQIFHFRTKNKPFSEDPASKAFVDKYLSQAKMLTTDADALKFASDNTSIEGALIELGVCTGKTINFIGALNPTKKIYGFDSFRGLPEPWIRADLIMKKGTFGFKNSKYVPPPVLPNIILIKGNFADTLPQFVSERLKETPIALLHIDSDLYSPAKTGLSTLAKNIVPGTIIIFDEFYNYPGFEEHEFKAFMEFLKEHSFAAEFLAYNMNHEQVVLRIIKTP